MATKYVTLKDSNGDTLYPQAVATNLAPDSIPQSEIDFSTIDKAQKTYQPRLISANKDLNTTEFLDLTGYQCGMNATAATISHCPTSHAFVMNVTSFGDYNNVSTDAWATRIRTITSLYGGDQWVQIVQGGATPGSLTYGPWNVVTKTYIAGTSCSLGDANSGEYQAGRQRSQSGNKYIWTQVYLDRDISSNVSTITFTPSGYNEAFGDQGVIFSIYNPTSSQLKFSCSKGPRANIVLIIITILDSAVSVSTNHPCAVNLRGTLSFSS